MAGLRSKEEMVCARQRTEDTMSSTIVVQSLISTAAIRFNTFLKQGSGIRWTHRRNLGNDVEFLVRTE